MDGSNFLDEMTKKRAARHLPLTWLSDIRPCLNAPWRIHGLLPKAGLALIFGESGSGKTYLATDLALHLASGQPWCERRTKQGVVVYVAAESPSSLQSRAVLWREQCAVGGELFAMIPQAINLLDPIKELLDVLIEIKREHGDIAAIIFDTVARSMPGGDENSGRDMGLVIANCDAIRETVDTLVVLIHHAGKDSSRGARGHSSLRAAVDTEIEVTVTSGKHYATVTKQRDTEAGTRFEFLLKSHPVGETEDGETVTACLVSELVECAKTTIKTGQQKKLTAAESVALAALHAVLDKPSHRVYDIAGKPDQFGADYEAWRTECYSRHISDGEAPAKRQAFNRAVTGLQSKGRIKAHEEAAWLA